MSAGCWFFISLVAGAAADFNPKGSSSCPCVEWAGLQSYIQNGKLMYTPPGSAASYEYPTNYGNLECKAHDSGLDPHCSFGASARRTGSTPPAWCGKSWCYVSKDNCDGVQPFKSVKFPGTDAYYSYRTCGESNEFTLWAEGVDAGAGEDDSLDERVSELLKVVYDYLWSTRDAVEEAYVQMKNSSLSACDYVNFCPCLECYQNTLWGEKIDPATVGAWLQPASSEQTAQERNLLTCLVGLVASTYSSVAAKEGEVTKRVGYQYFADQMTGSYVGWPTLQWCPTNYDSRFRDWYSTGSTGPKDVLIVVDVSGSMGEANRYNLAKSASKAVLDTLTWKDHASVILFNHEVAAQYSERLTAVTAERRDRIKAWMDTMSWQSGGTNFKVALDAAMNMIRESVRAGTTSMCQKAIIFLTDGQASFTDEDFRSIQQQALTYDAILFTYALGSGADTTKAKRLACENRGIFYNVPDGADLSRIMSSYYEYFATGQEICHPSFSSYTDIVTSTKLWPVCLPAYDRTGADPSLLGVSCLDFNMIVDPATMQSKPYWDNFSCKISDMTKMCQQLDTSPCRLERLRAAVGPDSVCAGTTPPDSCACVDPDCQDDPSFIDEKGYFCDTWVGDDCTKAQEAWGFTAAGQQAVLTKCRRSCNQCAMVSPCPMEKKRCVGTETFFSGSCRACRTEQVSGLDIEERPMHCPGSAVPPSPYASDMASSCKVQLLAVAMLLACALSWE